MDPQIADVFEQLKEVTLDNLEHISNASHVSLVAESQVWRC